MAFPDDIKARLDFFLVLPVRDLEKILSSLNFQQEEFPEIVDDVLSAYRRKNPEMTDEAISELRINLLDFYSGKMETFASLIKGTTESVKLIGGYLH